MAYSIKFWDRIANRYSRTPISNKQAYEKKLVITLKYFTPDSEVFEFGCGTGSTAILHAPYVGSIRAIDVSHNMLEIARKKADDEAIENITFEQTSIEDISVPDAFYDVVLGLSILHLLDDKEAVIDKVFKMLKPGGVFVSSTLCARGRMKMIRPFLVIGHFFGLLPKVHFFSASQFQLSLTDAGFRLDHIWQPEKSDAAFIVARKPARV